MLKESDILLALASISEFLLPILASFCIIYLAADAVERVFRGQNSSSVIGRRMYTFLGWCAVACILAWVLIQLGDMWECNQLRHWGVSEMFNHGLDNCLNG